MEINISDKILIEDTKNITKKENKNYIRIYDKDNNLIIEEYNEVVEYGRLSIIEKLFNNFSYSIDNGTFNENYCKEWISCFGVGNGGAPLSEGFNPYIVAPTTKDLANKLQFTLSKFSNVDNDYRKPKYHDNNTKKDFTELKISYDKENNKIYALATCELDYSELLGATVNELGFYFATHTLEDGEITEKTNFRLFSKINLSSAINKSNSPIDDYYKLVYRVYI